MKRGDRIEACILGKPTDPSAKWFPGHVTDVMGRGRSSIRVRLDEEPRKSGGREFVLGKTAVRILERGRPKPDGHGVRSFSPPPIPLELAVEHRRKPPHEESDDEATCGGFGMPAANIPGNPPRPSVDSALEELETALELVRAPLRRIDEELEELRRLMNKADQAKDDARKRHARALAQELEELDELLERHRVQARKLSEKRAQFNMLVAKARDGES